MTTPIAGGKITREAMLAAALEIIGLVHAGVDGEDTDCAGAVTIVRSESQCLLPMVSKAQTALQSTFR